MQKFWILSAWHRKICETSVFLLDEDCLSAAGFSAEFQADDLKDYYFGPNFGNMDVIELVVVSGNLESLPLEFELRSV